MNNEHSACRLHLAKAEQEAGPSLLRFVDLREKTQREYRARIMEFLCYVKRTCRDVNGRYSLNRSRVLAWMHHVARGITTNQAAAWFSCVNQFLKALVPKGLITGNPMLAILTQFGRRGWKGLAWASKSKPIWPRLATLRIGPLFTNEFGHHAQAYIALHRAAGRKYRYDERLLAEVNSFLDKQSVRDAQSVTTELVQAWTHSMTCNPSSRRKKLAALKRFFGHLCGSGVVRSNPVTSTIMDNVGPRQARFEPYIYSPPQIGALLKAAHQLPCAHNTQLKPHVLHTALILLYSLGLRSGEALRLRIQDVDIDGQTIFIRDSKFHKDRIVPFGPELSAYLQKYLKRRRALPYPARPADALLISAHGRPMTGGCFRSIFPQLLQKAGIAVPPGRRRPRPHDLRHAFAVHRLLRWYKQGVDVQGKLVLLSTFMGHVDIYSTQIYLTITESLLAEANKRFHQRFGTFFEQET